jgi:hypothetical protein
MAQSHATVSVSLTLITIHLDAIDGLLCPGCSGPMDLHQPDTGFPERMLWTCPHCATWFLMDIDPSETEAVLVCLPDHGFFRSELGA